MARVSNVWKKINEKGIKHIFTVSIPSRINKHMTEIVDWIGYKLYKKKPLQDVIVIESHNDFDSNGGAFYDYLILNGYNKKYKIVWFLRNECQIDFPQNVEGYRYNKPSLRRAYYHCVAKYLICGHYMIPSIRSGQKSVYTTHGAFSLKNSNGKVIVPDNIDYVLIPSEEIIALQARQLSISCVNNRLVVLGFPCQDVLYCNSQGDLKKITNRKYNKTILWMPTLRQSGNRNDFETTSPLGIPIFKTLNEYKELNQWLKKRNIFLIIKIHPMQDLSKVKVELESNVFVLNGIMVKNLKIDNNKLMKDVDALISDYSSSSYDFLHLNRPIAYTLDDLCDYKLGLPVDNLEDYIGGQKIYNKEDFYKFLSDVSDNKDEYAEMRKKCFDKIFKYHDGNSCERLCNFLKL